MLVSAVFLVLGLFGLLRGCESTDLRCERGGVCKVERLSILRPLDAEVPESAVDRLDAPVTVSRGSRGGSSASVTLVTKPGSGLASIGLGSTDGPTAREMQSRFQAFQRGETERVEASLGASWAMVGVSLFTMLVAGAVVQTQASRRPRRVNVEVDHARRRVRIGDVELPFHEIEAVRVEAVPVKDGRAATKRLVIDRRDGERIDVTDDDVFATGEEIEMAREALVEAGQSKG